MRITQLLTLAGRTKTVDMHVTEFDTPSRIAFVYDGPPRVRGGFTLEVADEATRVTIFASALLSGAVELVEDRIREAIEAEARHELAQLKSRIESAARREGA